MEDDEYQEEIFETNSDGEVNENILEEDLTNKTDKEEIPGSPIRNDQDSMKKSDLKLSEKNYSQNFEESLDGLLSKNVKQSDDFKLEAELMNPFTDQLTQDRYATLKSKNSLVIKPDSQSPKNEPKITPKAAEPKISPKSALNKFENQSGFLLPNQASNKIKKENLQNYLIVADAKRRKKRLSAQNFDEFQTSLGECQKHARNEYIYICTSRRCFEKNRLMCVNCATDSHGSKCGGNRYVLLEELYKKRSMTGGIAAWIDSKELRERINLCATLFDDQQMNKFMKKALERMNSDLNKVLEKFTEKINEMKNSLASSILKLITREKLKFQRNFSIDELLAIIDSGSDTQSRLNSFFDVDNLKAEEFFLKKMKTDSLLDREYFFETFEQDIDNCTKSMMRQFVDLKSKKKKVKKAEIPIFKRNETAVKPQQVQKEGDIEPPNKKETELKKQISSDITPNLISYSPKSILAITRFQGFNKGWRYGKGSYDAITFSFNNSVSFYGIGVFGLVDPTQDDNPNIPCLILIHKGSQAVSSKALFSQIVDLKQPEKTTEENKIACFHFSEPIDLRGGEDYTCTIYVKRVVNTWFGERGVQLGKDSEGTEVSFKNTLFNGCRSNGTGIHIGQIPEIYYKNE